MGNLTAAATFVMILNVLMWLGQVAALDINPAGAYYYNCTGSLLDDGSGCKDYVLDTGKISEDLPSAEGSISPTTGNLFTDTFSSIKTWVGKTTGIKYIFNILSAPYNLIKSIPNLPVEFSYAVGTLWYVITFIVIIAFFWGRE